MSVEQVRNYLRSYSLDNRIKEFTVSSATVELAAEALGTDGARIAKTISFYGKDGGCVIVVTAGDHKIDNQKFKARFGFKPKMLSPDDALSMTGHAVGGVCPFAIPDGIPVYLDVSLKRFDVVYPAAGSSSSAVELSCDELFLASRAESWEDICRSRDL